MFLGEKINATTTIVGMMPDAVYISYTGGVVKWFPESDSYVIETMDANGFNAYAAILAVKLHLNYCKELYKPPLSWS